MLGDTAHQNGSFGLCFRPRYIGKLGFAVPCGKCFECRVRRSREWSFRLVGEARHSDSCCMVTLTYDDEHLPQDGSVSRREVQLFMKRLRKAVAPCRVRFFACGEYGDKFGRPHYHIMLFGYSFPDSVFFKKDNKGTRLFRSPLLEKLWTFGYSSIVKDISLQVCRYVALYMQKPPTNKQGRPFVQMSNRPGIGYADVKPEFLASDKLYVDGQYIRIPRYYLNVLERQGYSVGYVKECRKAMAYKQYLSFLKSPAWTFKTRRDKIAKIVKIFGRRLDKNLMI